CELALRGVPVSMVFVPIAHDLVHATAVHTSGLVPCLLDEVPKELGFRRKRIRRKILVVDVAVQGLVHCKDELSHPASPHPKSFGRTPTCTFYCAIPGGSTAHYRDPLGERLLAKSEGLSNVQEVKGCAEDGQKSKEGGEEGRQARCKGRHLQCAA